jgi:hypothetical protein
MDNLRLATSLNEKNIEYNDIQKMIFIYNALQDGWTVKKMETDKYEFIKDKEHIKKEVVLENCIKEYIKYNIIRRS